MLNFLIIFFIRTYLMGESRCNISYFVYMNDKWVMTEILFASIEMAPDINAQVVLATTVAATCTSYRSSVITSLKGF